MITIRPVIASPDPDDDRDDENRTPRQQRRRANGEGTIGRRKDGRYEAKVFVRCSDGSYSRRSVYGKTRAECRTEMLSSKRAPKAGCRLAPPR